MLATTALATRAPAPLKRCHGQDGPVRRCAVALSDAGSRLASCTSPDSPGLSLAAILTDRSEAAARLYGPAPPSPCRYPGKPLRRRVFLLSRPPLTRFPPPPSVTAVPLQPLLPPPLAEPRSPPPPLVVVAPSCVQVPRLHARAALHAGPLPRAMVGRVRGAGPTPVLWPLGRMQVTPPLCAPAAAPGQ
jgi:hypothetical protein